VNLSLSSFPRLKTSRLLLRETIQEDAAAIFNLFSDSKVTRFHNLDTFTRIEEAIEVIERRQKVFESERGIRWVIALKQNNIAIGSCGFTWHKEANSAEVGYELASHLWQQGIMTEALFAILQFGFKQIDLHCVVAKVMLKNLASQKLLKKFGFQSQGVLKNHGFWKQQSHDLEQFLLTEFEFDRLNL
jgi:[ribosomal protein S5]-alanine N-acetyltransferase